MKHFKSGTFARDNMPTSVRPFSPHISLTGIDQVDLQALWDSGKRLLLLDVDNTLLPWKAKEVPPESKAFLTRARELGFDLCAISNTRHPERLTVICGLMEIDFIRDKFKPSRRMYNAALEKYGRTPEQTMMIGDQLLTDIWGANRAGIDAIWVRRLGKEEFIGTRLVSRNVEKLLGTVLYRYFQAEEADVERRPGFFRRAVFQQMVKFAMVGGLATAVDLGLHNFLYFRATSNGVLLKDRVAAWAETTFGLSATTFIHPNEVAFPVLKVGPVLLAILISYLMNRWLTFQATHEKITVRQVVQFYAVALVGMLISITAGTVVNAAATGTDEANWLKASIVGMVAGFIWNFNVQRRWTFKKGSEQ